MVERQLRARGIEDERVLDAILRVPREEFVPEELRGHAYEDRPLPIGEGQTISQPYVVALMAEAAQLGPDDVVLEVGTGSGYGAAVLSCIARWVWTLERIPQLAEAARRRLEHLGFRNVSVVVGDGSVGLPDHAPYQAIVVTAAAPRIPGRLVDQLDLGGRLVIPVGPDPWAQDLLVVTRTSDGLETRSLGPVAFVPLVGEDAF
ncbi:MAG: hypothetical protein KatS3mg008_1808 [Acidimicrobiales bacterium]|nr:MAG: hypothetical protein KatS3mg008_1808 [Acidimicrobiales bacterium]